MLPLCSTSSNSKNNLFKAFKICQWTNHKAMQPNKTAISFQVFMLEIFQRSPSMTWISTKFSRLKAIQSWNQRLFLIEGRVRVWDMGICHFINRKMQRSALKKWTTTLSMDMLLFYPWNIIIKSSMKKPISWWRTLTRLSHNKNSLPCFSNLETFSLAN